MFHRFLSSSQRQERWAGHCIPSVWQRFLWGLLQESWSGTPLVLSSAGPRLLHRNQDVDGFLGFCVWRAYPVGMYREGVEGLNDSSSGTSAPQSQYPERRLRGQTIHSRLNSFMCYIAGWAGQGSRCVWAAAVNYSCNGPPFVSALRVHVDKGRELCARRRGGAYILGHYYHTFLIVEPL